MVGDEALQSAGESGAEVRLGLIGCGRVAERGYLPALARMSGIRLVAVADPVLSRCRQLAPAAPAHESAEELVAAGSVDAVVIATPGWSHHADAAVAARAGLSALVEKPPAGDADEATAIAELEPAPWIGFNRRYDPALQRLRAAIPEAGQLELVLELCNPGGSWNSHVVRDDALLTLGPHLIDLARWLTGSEIERVRATRLDADDAVIELAFARGRAEIHCATNRRARDRIEVRIRGRRPLRHAGHGAVRRVRSRLMRPGRTGALVHLIGRQLEEFAAAARGARPELLATAADGLAAMAVIDGARLSAESGARWCPLQAQPVRH